MAEVDLAATAGTPVSAAQALTTAVRSQRRLRLLAQVAGLLGAPLDLQLTLQRVADLAIDELVDWCAADLEPEAEPQPELETDDQRPILVAVAHKDLGHGGPGPGASAAVPASCPARLSGERLTAGTLSPIRGPVVDRRDASDWAGAQDEQHLAVLRSLGEGLGERRCRCRPTSRHVRGAVRPGRSSRPARMGVWRAAADGSTLTAMPAWQRITGRRVRLAARAAPDDVRSPSEALRRCAAPRMAIGRRRAQPQPGVVLAAGDALRGGHGGRGAAVTAPPAARPWSWPGRASGLTGARNGARSACSGTAAAEALRQAAQDREVLLVLRAGELPSIAPVDVPADAARVRSRDGSRCLARGPWAGRRVPLLGSPEARAWAALPLIYDGHVVAAVRLGWRERQVFATAHRWTLQAVAAQYAAALMRALSLRGGSGRRR